jgi:hypothetical protein
MHINYDELRGAALAPPHEECPDGCCVNRRSSKTKSCGRYLNTGVGGQEAMFIWNSPRRLYIY